MKSRKLANLQSMKKKESKVVDRYRIACKFNENVIIPSNAIERRFYERDRTSYVEDIFITVDGVECYPTFCTSWINGNDLDDFCKDKFGISFEYIRSAWISRLGGVDNSWHYVKLTKSNYEN